MSEDTEWGEGHEFSLFHHTPRKTLAPYWVICIAILFGLAAAMISFRLYAALAYQDIGSNGKPAMLRLSEAPCANETVRGQMAKREVPEKYREKFKAAVLTWGGKDWHSCWLKIELIDQNGKEHEFVWSIDEEGAPFNPPYGVPLRLFKDDTI